MIGNSNKSVEVGRAAGIESFLYSGGDLFDFSKALITYHFQMELVIEKAFVANQFEAKVKLVNY
jgi:hypothetical protein